MWQAAGMSDGIPIHADDVPAQRWEAGEINASRKRLGAAANALRMGVAIIEIAPGARSTPAHAHVCLLYTSDAADE